MPSRIEIIYWIAENKRPFTIVKDRGFVDLMKTGRPMYRLPSPATVARDVKHVFVGMHSIIALKLKVSTYFTVHVADLIPKSRRHTMLRLCLILVLHSHYVTHLSSSYLICTTGPFVSVYRTYLGSCTRLGPFAIYRRLYVAIGI